MLTSILKILLVLSCAMHPLHISVANIEYKNETKEFEISIRIFHEDFSKAVSIFNNKNIELGKFINNDQKQEVNSYIKENFKLFFNDNKKPEKLIFDKYKLKNASIWLYYRIKVNKKINNLKIKDSILNAIYKDQNNLIIFSYKDEEEGFRLNNKKDFVILKL